MLCDHNTAGQLFQTSGLFTAKLQRQNITVINWVVTTTSMCSTMSGMMEPGLAPRTDVLNLILYRTGTQCRSCNTGVTHMGYTECAKLKDANMVFVILLKNVLDSFDNLSITVHLHTL